MVEFRVRKKPTDWRELIGRCIVSFFIVPLTQFTQFLVPQFFSDSSLFLQLLLSALLLLAVSGSGVWFRRLLRIHASAPAFVFFNILFVWAVYMAIVRQAASYTTDLLLNGQIILLIFGLYSILSSDPGFVSYSASPSDVITKTSVSEIDTHHQEIEFLMTSPHIKHSAEVDIGLGDRVRCCHSCKAYVKGFDHHCPAFGNCIGHKNYLLFMVLLIGFIWTEATYTVCLSQYAAKSELSDGTMLEISFSRKLASSIMLFSILQWCSYCGICIASASTLEQMSGLTGRGTQNFNFLFSLSWVKDPVR